jgi:hypothetical protein
MTISRWTHIAGWFALGGGTAWLAKIAVIVATDGRIIDTGAAAWLMRAGLIGLFVGSTGVTLWAARRRGTGVRIAAVVLAPVVAAASLAAIGILSTVLVRNLVGARGPAYAGREAGIVVAAVVGLAVGAALLRQVHGAARPAARGAV